MNYSGDPIRTMLTYLLPHQWTDYVDWVYWIARRKDKKQNNVKIDNNQRLPE
jgi:hypothetical protein